MDGALDTPLTTGQDDHLGPAQPGANPHGDAPVLIRRKEELMHFPRGPELTPRDTDILCWLGRHGLATPEQVARRFFHSTWAAYRRLRKLEAMALIRRDRSFWKAPSVLRLTTAGVRVADAGVGPAELVLAEVRHALALVDLTEALLAAHPGATLVTEREFRAAQLRALRDGTGRRPGRIPDGVLQLPPDEGETRVALELDLTSKRAYAITRIIGAYTQLFSATPTDDGFGAVWWYVLPGMVERVREIVQEARALDFIDVREWEP